MSFRPAKSRVINWNYALSEMRAHSKSLEAIATRKANVARKIAESDARLRQLEAAAIVREAAAQTEAR